MPMLWKLQDAKQRFSELVRAAQELGAQVITRHGEEVVVVIDIAEYHRLKGDVTDFKQYLRAGPDFDGLDLDRSGELPRELDWSDPS
jgi:prevent-host-death family protein